MSRNKIITTGNPYGDIALGFVPFIGSGMEWEEFAHNPSFGQGVIATLSTAADLFGLGLVRGGYKAYRLAKAAKKAEDAMEAMSNTRRVRRGSNLMHSPNPKKRAKGAKMWEASGYSQRIREADAAQRRLREYKAGQFERDTNMGIPSMVGGLILDVGQIPYNLQQIEKNTIR